MKRVSAKYMKHIRMFVTDLDGTLFNSKEQISQYIQKSFRELSSKGILPVIATGRMLGESQYAVKAIGATDYFIGMNGCIVEDLLHNKIIKDTYFKGESADIIYGLLKEEGFFFQVYTDKGVLCDSHSLKSIESSGLSQAYIKRYKNDILCYERKSLRPFKTYKFLIIERNTEKMNAFREKIGSTIKEVKIITSLNNYYEVIPEKIDKVIGLKVLCNYLNIELSQVAAIGDSENDIGMLKAAGVSIAVANASDQVKQNVDFVVPSNNEDGIVDAIESIILRMGGIY